MGYHLSIQLAIVSRFAFRVLRFASSIVIYRSAKIKVLQKRNTQELTNGESEADSVSSREERIGVQHRSVLSFEAIHHVDIYRAFADVNIFVGLRVLKIPLILLDFATAKERK